MYKIIFLDIDGTLLTSEHTILPGTLSSIQRIISKNKIPVILATARPPQAIVKIYNQLQLDSPVICCNGALILDKDTGDNFYYRNSIAIESSFVPIINDAVTGHTVSLSFYKLDQWITNGHGYWIQQEEEITETKAIISDTLLAIQKWVDENDGPNKILLMGEPACIESIEPVLKEITNHRLNIYKSKPTYLEIMNRAASKVSAINFLLDTYQLTDKDTLVIGDNYNDIEMLKLAGMGVAMGNAPDEVKAHADFITLDNDSEGIQFALDKFIK